jgi:diguanylate cyclase (GGDEF)-like protein/putative nucleotidyltransferase with HDIG domain
MRSAQHLARSTATSSPLRLLAGQPAETRSFAELIEGAQEKEREGNRLAARVAYERALWQIRTQDEARAASNVIRWIARSYQIDGDDEAAHDCLDAAIAIAEAWNDDAALGHALNVQAVGHLQRGNMDEAERLSLLARHRAIHAGDAKLAAMTAQNLGVLANIRGDFETAEQQYLASLADYRTLGLTMDICVALNNLGLLYTAQSRWADAERVLVEGAQISGFAGATSAQMQLDINLAELWVKRGEYSRAASTAHKVVATASQAGDASALGKATKLLGVIARQTGNFEEAERHFLRADEIANARGELLLQAEIARDRADLARRMGRNRDVLQQLNRAHRLFTQLRAQHDIADIDERAGSLEQEFLHVARRWGESIEANDRYTQGHCQRVAELACAIARQSGFDEASLFWFRIGALLHDVGKLVIPPEVLNKPGKLDEAEWMLMRSHPTAGVAMLAEIEFPWDVRPLVESHHERWDGKGYPHGLAGEAIPLIARILSIADVYDALSSVRSYKRAFTHQETVEILRKDVGTAFDPQVFAWFEQVAADWPSRIAHLIEQPAPPGDAAAARGTQAATSTDTDELTGMPVRRAFHEHGERLLEARRATGRPVAILVIDIDHFNTINDRFGHAQGDAVLMLVADRIRANTRTGDYMARYAGDEFVVLLPGTRLEDACIIAERIREAVAAATLRRGDDPSSRIRATVSIGVACAPLHGETLDVLFGAADSALYSAKLLTRDAVTAAARSSGAKGELLSHGFVGRNSERDRLRELLDQAVAGAPRLAVIFGEGGVGKSALLAQLGPDVGVRGGALATGQCIEANLGMPYGPWADIVRSAHRWELVPAAHWNGLARLVPALGDGSASGVVEDPASAGGSRRVLLENFEEYLRVASSVRPLVVVIDDMQWADPASWDVLEFLVARFRDQRLLICLTVRDEDLTAAGSERLRRLSRSERCAQFRLERLSPTELESCVRNTLGGQTPSDALLQHVASQSEGNPFFAVQTLRALVDEGRLRSVDSGWHFEPGEGSALPQAIEDLFSRRILRFSRAHRGILALAAVIGREFDPEALVTAYGKDEAEVHDALDEALASGVLAATTRTRSMLTFTHALLMEALLRDVNPLRVRRMHQQVAGALEALAPHDPAALVVHYDLAGCAADAFRTATEAGANAQALHAYENAAALYGIARRHAKTARECALVSWNLAVTEELQGNFGPAESNCSDVLSTHAGIAGELGILRAALRMRERLRLQRGVPAEQVFTVCMALLTEARQAHDVEETAALLLMLSATQQRIGNMAAAEDFARQGVEAAESTTCTSLLADAMTRLGSVLLVSNPASAVPHYRRALDMFTRLGDRSGQMRCHINVGSACDRAGNHPAAEASYLTALEIGREIRASDLTGVASLNLGVLLVKTGKADAARVRFEEALFLFTTIGHEPHRLASMYNLAHLARVEHDPAASLQLYEACIMLAGNISQADVHIGAMAGAGLAELDLGMTTGGRVRFVHARELVAGRDDWWFQSRELWEALQIRLMPSSPDAARAHLLAALGRAAIHDQYAALWLGAEFSDLLRAGDTACQAALHRLQMQARALGYQPLVARLAGAGASVG